jgi:hypothetical protein
VLIGERAADAVADWNGRDGPTGASPGLITVSGCGGADVAAGRPGQPGTVGPDGIQLVFLGGVVQLSFWVG